MVPFCLLSVRSTALKVNQPGENSKWFLELKSLVLPIQILFHLNYFLFIFYVLKTDIHANPSLDYACDFFFFSLLLSGIIIVLRNKVKITLLAVQE